jgi:hypothetical protein
MPWTESLKLQPPHSSSWASTGSSDHGEQGIGNPRSDDWTDRKGSACRFWYHCVQTFDYYEIVTVDNVKSLRWATISAENGYPGRMYVLGFKLAKERDHNSRIRAKYWLEKQKKMASTCPTIS